MNRIIKIYIVLFIFCSFSAFAQQKKTDSLLKKLKTASNKEKVDILILISKENTASSTEKALDFGKQALELASRLEYKAGLAEAYYNAGLIHYIKANFPEALDFYLKAIQIKEKLADKEGLHLVLISLGMVYNRIGNYEKALEALNEGLKISQAKKDKRNLAQALNNIGNVYYLKKDFNKAFEYHLDALNLRKEIKDNPGIYISYNNVGVMSDRLHRYNEARFCYFKALEIYEAHKDSISLSSLSATYDNIGDLYIKQGNLDEALVYLNKGLDLAVKLGAKNRILESYLSLSLYYEAKSDLAKALVYHKKYTEMKDQIFSEEKSKQMAEMLTKYDAERKQNENEALKKDRQFQQIQISANKATLQRQYAITIAVSGALFTVLVLAFILIRTNRQKQKINQLLQKQRDEILEKSKNLEEANTKIAHINTNLEDKIAKRTQRLREAYNELTLINKEMDMFLYRSSHDLRRPLTTIMGLIQLADMSDNESDLTSQELFKQINKTADGMDKMLRKLQMVSEVNNEYIKNEKIDFKEILEEILSEYSLLITENHIDFQYQIEESLCIKSNSSLLKIALQNIVENAIIFRNRHQAQSYIAIDIFLKEKSLFISVKDNGFGIDTKYSNLIFEMYFRANEKSKGNGLGLYVAKKAIERLNGKISFESTLGEGTDFLIIIPSKSE